MELTPVIYHVQLDNGILLVVKMDPAKAQYPGVMQSLVGDDPRFIVSAPGKVVEIRHHGHRSVVKGINLLSLATSFGARLRLAPVIQSPPKPRPEPYKQEELL